MAFSKQVIDARNSGQLKKVSGVSGGGQQFLDLLNEAQSRLCKRGEFWGLDQTMAFCVDSCDIVWPYFIGTILGLRFRSQFHQDIAHPYNNWFSFTNGVSGWHGASGFGGAYNGDVMMGYGRGHSQAVIEDNGTAPTFNQISGTTGKYVQYHIVNPNDIGATITLYGRQYGNQPLQQTINGVTVAGQTISATGQYDAETPNLITRIDNVVRTPTQGMCYLYELDPATGLRRMLAAYSPNETNPNYRRSRLINHSHFRSAPDSNGSCWTSIEALVKLQYTQLVNDYDFLLIDDFDALKLAIQGIKLEEANDSQNAEVKWVEAIRELNMLSRDKNPDRQTSMRYHVTGRTLRNPI